MTSGVKLFHRWFEGRWGAWTNWTGGEKCIHGRLRVRSSSDLGLCHCQFVSWGGCDTSYRCRPKRAIGGPVKSLRDLFSVPTSSALSSPLILPGEAEEAHPMLYVLISSALWNYLFLHLLLPTANMIGFKLPDYDYSSKEKYEHWGTEYWWWGL